MTGYGMRDVAGYQARALAAETGCAVSPHPKPGRFEVEHPGGVMIGTAEMILAWHREAVEADRRAAAMREWLAALGTLSEVPR